jgi:hypothetical protein
VTKNSIPMPVARSRKYGGENRHDFRFWPSLTGVLRILATIAIGITSSLSHAQIPFSENFSTTVFRDSDPGKTTADWNTTFEQLLLPVSPRLSGIIFGETSVVEMINGRYTTRALALADLNGDGNLDLIDGVLGPSGVHLNNGGGLFGGRSYTSPVFRNTRDIAVGDVDRDGDIDFVLANISQQIKLYLNDGTGTSYVIQNVSTNISNTNGVALADVDDDGFLDVIASNIDFQPNRLFVNTANPLTPFGPSGSDGIVIGPATARAESSREVTVGDLDRDGDLDIVFLNDDKPNPKDNNREQRNRVLMNRLAQGSPYTFLQSEIEIDGFNDVRFSRNGALGDIDGDGFLDLVVCNSIAGQASSIYLNNGAGVVNANPFTIAAVNFAGEEAADSTFACGSVSLADADNDGDLDIFLATRSTAHRNRVYFNDGTGVVFTSVDVGPVGQSPLILPSPADIGATSTAAAIGDVDNDGDIDWVVGNQTLVDSVSGPLENILFRNTGTAGAESAQQLRAKATSLQFDNSGANSLKLIPSPDTTNVGHQFLSKIHYWVSGNGGTTWASISPGGRPVAISTGTDIRWRAELRSESPALAASLALLQLDIVANDSGPMLVTPIGSAEVNEDDGITGLPIVSDFVDADGDTIYHSLIGLPIGSGLGIDPLTGEISGVPSNEDSLESPISLTVFATDGALTATDTFSLTVINANDPPVIESVPPVSNAVQDVLYTYEAFALDPDPNETQLLRFSLTSAPPWLSLTDNLNGTATLSGSPANSDVTGDGSVVLIVSDPDGLTDTQSFEITVDNVNDPPVFMSSPPDAGATIGVTYTYNIVTNDPDDGETSRVTISAVTKPAWLTFTDNGDGTAVLTGTPAAANAAANNAVALEVLDPGGLGNTQTFTIAILNANFAPVFQSVANTIATEESEYRYSIRAVDPNGDALTIMASILPNWLTLIDRGQGFAILSGTPRGRDVGPHSVVIQAIEDTTAKLTASQQFVITVDSTGNGPSLTLNGDTELNIFQDWNFDDPGATARDIEDGDLTDRIQTEGTVNTSAPGVYVLTYTVSDSAGNSAQAVRIVRVVAAPREGGAGFSGFIWLLVLSFVAYRSRLNSGR